MTAGISQICKYRRLWEYKEGSISQSFGVQGVFPQGHAECHKKCINQRNIHEGSRQRL